MHDMPEATLRSSSSPLQLPLLQIWAIRMPTFVLSRFVDPMLFELDLRACGGLRGLRAWNWEFGFVPLRINLQRPLQGGNEGS